MSTRLASRSLLSGISAIVLGSAPPAWAEPREPHEPDAGSPARQVTIEGDVDGNVGVVLTPFGRFLPGIEGEFGARVAGLRYGGVAWVPMFGSGLAMTGWAGVGFTPWGRDRAMVLGGLTSYPQTGVACFDTCGAPSRGGVFVGASYTFQEKRLWLRVTPQLFLPFGNAYYPALAMSGVPWVELGVPVTDNFTLSFRLGETIFKAALTL